MVAHLTIDDFRGHEHGKFMVHPSPTGEEAAIVEPVEMTLIDIEAHPAATPEGGKGEQPRTAFSLLFAGPADRPMPCGIYRITHEGAGEHEVFLSPVRISPHDPHFTEGLHYEVVFN